MFELDVRAIEPARLEAMRARGVDEHGNPWRSSPAFGWEPLRCCLTVAQADASIVLISYQPLAGPSPWAEVGPIYVHAEPCAGYRFTDAVPAAFSTGPRLLRTYRADGSLDYEHIRTVAEDEHVEPVLRALLADPDIAFVHVRAVQSQCFTFAATRAP